MILDNIHKDQKHPSFERNFLSYLANEFHMFQNFDLFLENSGDKSVSIENYDYLLVIRSGFVIHYLERFLKDFPAYINDSCFMVAACLTIDRVDTWRALLVDLKRSEISNSVIKPSEIANILKHQKISPRLISADDCAMHSVMLNNESDVSYYQSLQTLLKLTNFDTHSFFSRNTESINNDLRNLGPFDHLILPASGLMCFDILRETGIGKASQKSIEIYDVSIGALFIYNYLFHSWDGKDYHRLFEGPFSFLCKARINEDQWRRFIDSFGGLSEWLSFFKQVRNEYSFHSHKSNALARNFKDKFFLNESREGNTYFSMSNIFTYWICSLEHPFSVRVRRLNEIMTHLKTSQPEMVVYFLKPKNVFANKPENQRDLIFAKNFQKITLDQHPWETPLELMTN